MSTNELQEWTLEKQETEQVTFRFADNLLKFRPLINNAARVIRSVGIAHEVPEFVYLPRKVPDYVLKKEKDGYLNVRGFTRRLTQVNTQIATGTDGTYPLYEDEGTNYNYEKGAYSCIRLFGDDTHSTLVIGKRSGKYEGIEPVRNLKIVKIALSSDGKSNVTEKSVVYKGEELKIAF